MLHTPIPGWPGYSADRDGNIYSVTSNWRGYGCRRMSVRPDKDGYLKVRLMINSGTRRQLSIHSLIALTFLGPRPSAVHEIRHLDGQKANNADVNLAWGTRKDNAVDRENHGHTSRGARHSTFIRAGLEKRAT